MCASKFIKAFKSWSRITYRVQILTTGLPIDLFKHILSIYFRSGSESTYLHSHLMKGLKIQYIWMTSSSITCCNNFGYLCFLFSNQLKLICYWVNEMRGSNLFSGWERDHGPKDIYVCRVRWGYFKHISKGVGTWTCFNEKLLKPYKLTFNKQTITSDINSLIVCRKWRIFTFIHIKGNTQIIHESIHKSKTRCSILAK